MSIMLVKYTTPVDVWVAWECKYWSQWTYVNEADPDTAETIRCGRSQSVKQIFLFFELWRLQSSGGRHCTGENPWGSRCFEMKQFHEKAFLDTAYWCDMSQCGYGCSPPWCFDESEVHQKRTCLVSTRESISTMAFACSKEHRDLLKHVALQGSYNGKCLTAWAENNPQKLAKALCDALGVSQSWSPHDQMSDEAFAGGALATEVIEDQSLIVFLESLAEGTHRAEIFTSSELDVLTTFTGIQISYLIVKHKPTTYLMPTREVTRRCTIAKVDGSWVDIEGSVLLTSMPKHETMAFTPDTAVAVFGEPLLRLRARSFPNDAREPEAMAWLRKFHIGTAHSSPEEMAQSVKDAGGSSLLQRLALQYKCPLCDIDSLDKARHRSALPMHTRAFNMIVLIDVVDIELQRNDDTAVKTWCSSQCARGVRLRRRGCSSLWTATTSQTPWWPDGSRLSGHPGRSIRTMHHRLWASTSCRRWHAGGPCSRPRQSEHLGSMDDWTV